MTFDMRDDSPGNIAFFEGYMSVRAAIREREEVRLHGEGMLLENQKDEDVMPLYDSVKAAKEAHCDRMQEYQIKHLAEEYEEKMLYARIQGRDEEEERHRLKWNQLKMLLHVMQGRRWAKAWKNEDMMARLQLEEKKLRSRIKLGQALPPKTP